MAARGAIGMATCVAGVLAGAFAFQLACGSSYEEEASAPDAATGSDAGVAPPPKCGDPGSQCVVVPPGWIVVSTATLDGDAGAGSCPPYFTESRVLAENPRSSEPTCTCACAMTSANPCLGGTVDTTIHNGGANCNDGKYQVILDGTCRALPQNWPSGTTGVVTTVPTPAVVTCGAPVTTAPGRLVDGRINVCTSPPPAPCGEGACVAAGSDVKTCVVREGEHDCPAPYGNRRFVVDESGIVDSRKCEKCTCSPKPTSCTNGTLTFHQAVGCTDVGSPSTPGVPCEEITGIGSAEAYRYSVSFDGGCAPNNANPPVQGELALPPKQTLCCK